MATTSLVGVAPPASGTFTAPGFDSTAAVLAYSRLVHESFEKHICIPEDQQTDPAAGVVPPATGAKNSPFLAKVSRTALGGTCSGLTRCGLAIVLLGIGCLDFAARGSTDIPADRLSQQAVGPRIELHLDDQEDSKPSLSVDDLLYRGGSRPEDIANYDPDRPARMLTLPSAEENKTISPRAQGIPDDNQAPQLQSREAVLP